MSQTDHVIIGAVIGFALGCWLIRDFIRDLIKNRRR